MRPEATALEAGTRVARHRFGWLIRARGAEAGSSCLVQRGIPAREVGVARCSLDIAVAEQLSDHRESFAARQCPAGKVVP